MTKLLYLALFQLFSCALIPRAVYIGNYVPSYKADVCQEYAKTLGDPDTSATTKPFEFFLGHLFQQVRENETDKAFTETELHIQNDNWFWVDDNAKALELFAFPGYLDKYANEADQVVRFIEKLSPGPFFFRRYSRSFLEVGNDNVADFNFKTGLLYSRGNLVAGNIFLGFKFHDGRDEIILRLFTYQITYKYKGQDIVYGMQNAIAEIVVDGTNIILRQTFKPVVDGVVALNCVVETKFSEGKVTPSRHSTVSNVAGDVTDVVVHLGSDSLIGNEVQLSQGSKITKTQLDSFVSYPANRDVKWVALVQRGALLDVLGFKYTVGVAYVEGSMPDNIFKDGRSIISSYRADQGREAVVENIFMMAGGMYNTMEIYDPIFKDFDKWNEYEMSCSYDYGAELHSISMVYLADIQATGKFRYANIFTEDYLLPKFKAFYDNYMYPTFTRGAAFAAVGAENLYRATGNPVYLEYHQKIINGIITREPFDWEVDNSMSAVWALGRASLFSRDSDLVARTKDYFHRMSYTPSFTGDGTAVKSFLGDNIHWVFKAGVTLRAMKVLKRLHELGWGDFSPDDVERMNKITEYSLQYTELCKKESGEILTSYQSGETNSESQPWAMLGLTDIDQVALKVCPTPQ